MSVSVNIHPVFDLVIWREDKETLLDEKSCVVWMTRSNSSGRKPSPSDHSMNYLTNNAPGVGWDSMLEIHAYDLHVLTASRA